MGIAVLSRAVATSRTLGSRLRAAATAAASASYNSTTGYKVLWLKDSNEPPKWHKSQTDSNNKKL